MIDIEKLLEEWHLEICGGSATFDIFDWMNENFSEALSHSEELKICYVFDDNYFSCDICGWTLPISECNTDYDKFICEDCCETY